MNQRELFFRHLAQTSTAPPAIEIDRAEGVYVYDTSGKQYIDLIAGISVGNVGHRHPKVVEAIEKQLKKHLHVMVYGEYILGPQVQLAEALAEVLPEPLESCYFVNSGSEAIEGALKLAKKATGRSEIVAFKNAYHGSTHGALSIMGNDTLKQPFEPLLPDIKFLEFSNIDEINKITTSTACVVVEPIQGEAGVRLAYDEFMTRLRKRCDETNTLLIFDEIQTGLGRTGTLFAMEHYHVVPDILCLAKGLGGGMPIGAFIASKELMDTLSDNPALGHITTFGGHPVSCAAAHASLQVVLGEHLPQKAEDGGQQFEAHLTSPHIKELRHKGLLMAVQLESFAQVEKAIAHCTEAGLLTDWFLFCDSAIRIAPPLTIGKSQIDKACEILNTAITKACSE